MTQRSKSATVGRLVLLLTVVGTAVALGIAGVFLLVALTVP